MAAGAEPSVAVPVVPVVSAVPVVPAIGGTHEVHLIEVDEGRVDVVGLEHNRARTDQPVGHAQLTVIGAAHTLAGAAHTGHPTLVQPGFLDNLATQEVEVGAGERDGGAHGQPHPPAEHDRRHHGDDTQSREH